MDSNNWMEVWFFMSAFIATMRLVESYTPKQHDPNLPDNMYTRTLAAFVLTLIGPLLFLHMAYKAIHQWWQKGIPQ